MVPDLEKWSQIWKMVTNLVKWLQNWKIFCGSGKMFTDLVINGCRNETMVAVMEKSADLEKWSEIIMVADL